MRSTEERVALCKPCGLGKRLSRGGGSEVQFGEPGGLGSSLTRCSGDCGIGGRLRVVRRDGGRQTPAPDRRIELGKPRGLGGSLAAAPGRSVKFGEPRGLGSSLSSNSGSGVNGRGIV